MAVEAQFAADVEEILSHQHDNGGELWTTPDMRLLKGSPFNTLDSALYLLELGMEPGEPVLQQVAELIFSTWREDGQFKLYPKGTVFPCQTAYAVRALCHLGHTKDERVQKSLQHLLDTRYTDGGWRCNKFFFGRGPETEHSNPQPTVIVLDALRFDEGRKGDETLDAAVEFLLSHWETKAPIGPCHYGIGTLFMQVEYPFRNYNLFEYVYVLSFYKRARKDPRFLEALAALQAKTVEGQVVVERVVPKLAKLSFCRKGQPSVLATRRYGEIMRRVGQQV